MSRLARVAVTFAIAAAAACGGSAFTEDRSGVNSGGVGAEGGVGGSSGVGGKGGSGGVGGVSGVGGSIGGTGGSTHVCGNLYCEAPETCSSCPSDCACATGGTGGTGFSCGNQLCDQGESCSTCPSDCLCGTGGAVDGGLCSDPDGVGPSTRTTVSGVNGSFSDACDTSGNLIEYICETAFDDTCLPNPDPSCRYQTGLVVPYAINCAGRCDEGTCLARCPQQGDSLTYLSVDPINAKASIHNDTDGSSYSCTVIFDISTDTYNCTTAPVAGTTTKVYSLGGFSTTTCVSGTSGNIGTAQTGVQQCTYSCTVL
jgi:hypothetical protein